MRRLRGFLSRRRRAGAGSSQLAGVVLLPAAAQGREFLVVLGMAWHTILGKDLASQARRRARQAKATHWVHAGGRAESVGTVRLTRQALVLAGLPATRELHSAAQLFARSSGAGVHALAWRLNDGRCWFVLARDGQVLGSSDTVFESALDAAQALHAAYARFGAALQYAGDAAGLLANRGPDAVSSQAGSGQPGQERQGLCEPDFVRTDFPFQDAAFDLSMLAANASAASALQGRLGRLPNLPLPVAGLAGLALAGWMAQLAWQPASAPAVQAPEPQEQVLDPAMQWQLALDGFMAATLVPTYQGLEALWLAVGELPLRPQGWLLREVQCDLAQGVRWKCAAHYRRLNRLATNEGLVGRSLPGWHLQWNSLDDVSALFSLEVQALALRLPVSEPAALRYFPGADSLQQIRALFSRVEVGLPRPVGLSVPRDASGAELPNPGGLAMPRQRSILLHGPLRSLALLGPSLTESIAWRGLTVSLDPAATASIDRSVLVATLSGVSYEPHQ